MDFQNGGAAPPGPGSAPERSASWLRSPGKGSGRSGLLVLFAVWALSSAYAWRFVDRGWIPHDEGTLGQSAERVLAGELPHRDYDEGYTGGLTYLHALAFRLLGIRLLSLRFVLLAFFLLFVPALYAIASRMVSRWVAGLLTLLGVAWSVPNYFSSLPSWYNLFFATFGALALLYHVETGRRAWLLAAGVCAGLSVLIKIVGLYDVAAALLFLAYREQALSSGGSGFSRKGFPAFLLFKALACAAFLGLLLFVVRSRLELMDVLHFVLPAAAVAGVLVGSEAREGEGSVGQRFRALSRLLVPFGLGVALPIAAFLFPYLATDSLRDLVRGVFLLPQQQIGKARMHFPPSDALWAAVPYAALLAFPASIPRHRERAAAIGVSILLALALLFATSPDVYRILWYSARSLAVVATLVGCWVLVRSTASASLSSPKRQEIFLLVCLCALVGLVQYPFSAPIYFCYVAPLAALAVASIVTAEPSAPKAIHLCILCFYLVFAVLRLNPGYVFNLGIRSEGYEASARLRLARGGIRVPTADARVYEALVAAIREKGGGPEIYAGPDCPEVYFLSARWNPTRSFFDFQGGLYGRPDALFRLLEARGIRLVVLNRAPDFSPKPRPEFRAALDARFPRSVEIGKFTLMWRE